MNESSEAKERMKCSAKKCWRLELVVGRWEREREREKRGKERKALRCEGRIVCGSVALQSESCKTSGRSRWERGLAHSAGRETGDCNTRLSRTRSHAPPEKEAEKEEEAGMGGWGGEPLSESVGSAPAQCMLVCVRR